MKKVILLFFVTLLLSGCNRARQEQGQEDDDVTMDLPQLKAQGEITAVTLYSSTSYFQYKMQPMGYEYELIKDFARSEGLKLNIKAAESPTKLIEMLEAGEADVVAYPIQISNRMKEKLIYCGREEQDCQVLIQQANKGDKVITDVTELLGKDVYVKPGTKYFERLKNLDVELGGGIRIHEVDADTVTTEDLIGMVSQGEIPYTISDENIARLNKTYFWNLNVSLKVSFLQRSSWGRTQKQPQTGRGHRRLGVRQGGNTCLQGFDETLFRTEQTARHSRTAGSQKWACIALRRTLPQTCQKYRMGLAAARLDRLPGVPLQSERRLMGRRRRADGDHAEYS